MTSTTADALRTRLLILDDDPMIGATIKRIAEFDGHDVVYTERADDFFDQLDNWHPHIIALDLIMPDMNGVEVMEYLVARGCRAALIVSSGVGDRVLDAARRSARENGLNVVGVLPKPFSAKTLRSMLHEAARLTQNVTCAARVDPVRKSDPMPTEEELRAAMDAGHIRVAYQPKARCRSATLSGFEALARWEDAKYGNISPEIFIPVAEASGLIDRLTLQIASQALRWIAALPDQILKGGHSDPVLSRIQLSLNISARSLNNRGLFDELAAICRLNQVPLERVILELTETSAMEDAAVSLNTLTYLRLQGFSLSIDDFGTGYSSMVQLVRMPFSEIKIDKSFVMTAMNSSESRAVIRSVVDLGRSLGLETTAEGVEDEETMRYLKSLNCDIAQGYFISRPLCADDIPGWYFARRAQLEARRMDALHRLNLLNTPPEERFDRITRLAADAFGVDSVLISLVDTSHQWFKSRVNFSRKDTPRDIAFCNRTIEGDGVMVVEDATMDPFFCGNPLVTGQPMLRFYAGRPLFLDDGSKVGTLCLIDAKPRKFTDTEAKMLEAFAELVEEELRGSLQTHRNEITGLSDSFAFRRYAERALEISERFQLSIAMVGLELDLHTREIKDDETSSLEQRYIKLAQFAEQYKNEAFLMGHHQANKIGLLYLGSALPAAQSICQQLRNDLNDYNQCRENPEDAVNAAVSICDLADYLGAFTQQTRPAQKRGTA